MRRNSETTTSFYSRLTSNIRSNVQKWVITEVIAHITLVCTTKVIKGRHHSMPVTHWLSPNRNLDEIRKRLEEHMKYVSKLFFAATYLFWTKVSFSSKIFSHHQTFPKLLIHKTWSQKHSSILKFIMLTNGESGRSFHITKKKGWWVYCMMTRRIHFCRPTRILYKISMPTVSDFDCFCKKVKFWPHFEQRRPWKSCDG